MASICSMEIMFADSGVIIGMATVCGAAAVCAWGMAPSAAGWAFCVAGFSSGRSVVRFSAENARRRVCSTSSPSMPSSRALPPSWKLASMNVQPSSIAATPALYNSAFSSFTLLNLFLRNRLMVFFAFSISASDALSY